jgi:hypothetical protein
LLSEQVYSSEPRLTSCKSELTLITLARSLVRGLHSQLGEQGRSHAENAKNLKVQHL